jgi:Subtilase family/Bacterial Ig domain/Peptidase inhibitor I9
LQDRRVLCVAAGQAHACPFAHHSHFARGRLRGRLKGLMMRVDRFAACLAVSSLLACGQAGSSGGSEQTMSHVTAGTLLRAERAVPGQYLVVFNEGRVTKDGVDAEADDLARRHGGRIFATWHHALRGFAAHLSAAQAQALAQDPRVAWVEEDGEVRADTTQTGATWGLDRIDQRNLPLDGNYTYNVDGTGVNAYIIDTGIRTTHTQFGGRASGAFTAVNDGNGTNDCNGHGTHVSGTVGGSTFGVAKNVRLFAVRVLDCTGSGTTAGVISGVDWVTNNHVSPAVANMSLGGGASATLDQAVQNSINSGVTYAIAAGNSNVDACTQSPARVGAAITVAASDINDVRASFSNFGTCVDIFGPGVNITSSWATSDTATNTISGTSMATPHVTGTAALYLSANPAATPAQVASALTSNATAGAIASAGTGTPNRLLYEAFIGAAADATPPTVALTAPTAGATVSGTAVTLSASASDDVAVAKVDFLVDGAVVGSDTTSPYSISWNSTAVANGSHTFAARATDTSGNVATSAPVTATVSNTAATCTTTTQLFGNPGFETGTAAPWTATAGVIDGSASPAPHSGRFKAWLDGYGTTHTDDVFQTVTIPAGACSATLSFWLWITTAETTTTTAFDTLTVTVRNSAGTVLSTLATFSNLNKSATYVQRSFDVSAFKGQTVRIQFHGVEDVSLQTSFLVDDTALTVTQ